MKTEKTFWIIFVIAFILKLLNIPGNGILTVFSLFLLGILYWPACMYFFCDKKFKRQNLVFTAISGMFLAVIPIGILFKIQNYAGKENFLILGMIGGIGILIATYILKKKSSDELLKYYKNMLLRSIVLTVAIILFTFIPSRIIIQIQHRDDPELVRLLIQTVENPENDKYWEDLNKYVNKRDSIEFSKARQKN